MRFADVIGHKTLKNKLSALVDSNRVPHAILFGGVPGLGKLAMARAFAQYVHCTNPSNGDSCGVCPSCRQHMAFNHPDIHYEYPVVKRKSADKPVSSDFFKEWKEFAADTYPVAAQWPQVLSAENARPVIYVSQSEDIVRKASLTPLASDKKIFLIWLPEKMNQETANKLLKVIEEPYADTLFILVSNSPSEVLPTIFSRTQRFNFRPVDTRDIAEALQLRFGYDSTVAAEMAEVSSGSPGEAIALASHSEEPDEFASLFQSMMRYAYARQARSLKDMAAEVAAMGREKSIRFLYYCAEMTGKNFIFNIGDTSLCAMRQVESAFSSRFAPFIHAGNVEQLAAEFNKAAVDIGRNASAKVVMMDLLLKVMLLIRKQNN